MGKRGKAETTTEKRKGKGQRGWEKRKKKKTSKKRGGVRRREKDEQDQGPAGRRHRRGGGGGGGGTCILGPGNKKGTYSSLTTIDRTLHGYVLWGSKKRYGVMRNKKVKRTTPSRR